MQQRITIDFLGMSIESLELIGYDAGIDGLTSSVFSNLAPDALPYFWNVSGKNVEVKVNYGLLHATFTGEFSEDGNQYSGGWRPSPGADPAVNVAYDLSGVRVG
ncbi:MAG TPA: hypothetical protein VI341_12160 [Actinomycetota bacterium]